MPTVAMRNHNAKPRRETTTLNKNLPYLPNTTSTSYEARNDVTTVLRAWDNTSGGAWKHTIKAVAKKHKNNTAVTQDEITPIHSSLGRSSGPRIERYGGTAAYELCYPGVSAKAEALREELGATYEVYGGTAA